MKTMSNAPHLGAAYYPEDWNESEQEKDIAKMKEAGLNLVRIAEFSWRKMEPREGEFDFGWLHSVVDKLKDAGISVIMCTPSATPPIWLSRKHPDVMTVDKNGIPSLHGGRRHCCSANPHYRHYSARIAEKLAEEFANEPAVIGWQIDNEIRIRNGGCCCRYCTELFHKYLSDKYKTIENLNRSWNLNLFSQAFDSFDEIQLPVRDWQNPHIQLEWMLSQSRTHIDFIHMQADIIRKYSSAPIGTDMMPICDIDHNEMNEKLDVVQFNHYNTRENLWSLSFWLDYMRTIKDRPFWNTETSTCWNGSTAINQTMKPEGFCVANSWLPLALGGEANLYWLWRTHSAGHELVHGSVLTPAGRRMHIFGEVQKTAETFTKAADFLNGTRVDTACALMFSSLNSKITALQTVFNEKPHDAKSASDYYISRIINGFYKPITESGLRTDVIGTAKDLSAYRLIFMPVMMTLEENGLPERLEKWINDGGVLVAGPMTDIRNSVGANYTDRAMGMLERITGCTLDYSIPDAEGLISARWNDGTEFGTSPWYELYSADNACSLASVTGGHSSLIGKSVLLSRKVGRGTVILLGSFPSDADMRRISKMAAEKAEVPTCDYSGSLTVVPRTGENASGYIIIETAGKTAEITLPHSYTDILSEKTVSGDTAVGPYGVMVLRADKRIKND